MEYPKGMHFFFGEEDMLSNWHQRDFVLKDVHFNCAEQALMYCKAKYFGDEDNARRIMASPHPREQKRRGRLVTPYREAEWIQKREYFLFRARCAQFDQNTDMGDHLLSLTGYELVEASPYDHIWGAGLSAKDPLIHNRNRWTGKNLCGKTLNRCQLWLAEHRQRQEST